MKFVGLRQRRLHDRVHVAEVAMIELVPSIWAEELMGSTRS